MPRRARWCGGVTLRLSSALQRRRDVGVKINEYIGPKFKVDKLYGSGLGRTGCGWPEARIGLIGEEHVPGEVAQVVGRNVEDRQHGLDAMHDAVVLAEHHAAGGLADRSLDDGVTDRLRQRDEVFAGLKVCGGLDDVALAGVVAYRAQPAAGHVDVVGGTASPSPI